MSSTKFLSGSKSERSHQDLGKRHKQLTDRARQMVFQVRPWLPERVLVVVADSSSAVLELLAACQRLSKPVPVVTRLRLDAALYDPAYAHPAGRAGRPRKKGARQPTPESGSAPPPPPGRKSACAGMGVRGEACGWHRQQQSGSTVACRRCASAEGWLITDPEGQFEPQAWLSTKPEDTPTQMVEWFVMRWQLDVTFEEARAHPGIEPQRQWSDLAILRTTPALVSPVTLFAHHLLQGRALPVRQAAWYSKTLPTFSATLAFVCQQLWPVSISWMAHEEADILTRLTDALAYAA